ncbi:CtsR family transcriptional regulator [Vagococcus sp.]|uniref:CtsR family transcriptional regulator n=1 Tax=Vagococcus sp. TaxID=1933889 RepID=UPI003F9CC041
MDNRNMSDIIESYLKEILETTNKIEIRRSEMANLFNCVPSQINYVINTRFTVPKGYKVESKRGGGGYIRIFKINLLSSSDYLQNLTEIVESKLSESEAEAVLEQLHGNHLITDREFRLLVSLFDSKSLLPSENVSALRSQMMLSLLERLAYEELE